MYVPLNMPKDFNEIYNIPIQISHVPRSFLVT